MSQPSALAGRIVYRLDREGFLKIPQTRTLGQRADFVRILSEMVDEVLDAPSEEKQIERQ